MTPQPAPERRMRSFAQVDVFAETPYLGNPVAVVLNGDGLSDEDMARLATWTNLSETTFVVPPESGEADYALRIFTRVGRSRSQATPPSAPPTHGSKPVASRNHPGNSPRSAVSGWWTCGGPAPA